jgi:hypothetical protein
MADYNMMVVGKNRSDRELKGNYEVNVGADMGKLLQGYVL